MKRPLVTGVALAGVVIPIAAYLLLPHYYCYRLRHPSVSSISLLPAFLQTALGLGRSADCVQDDGRVRLIRSLGNRRSDLAVEPLFDLTEDDDEGVRRSAREALAKIGAARTIPEFQRRLKSPSESRRIDAATTLGYLNDRSAVEVLIGVLEDSSPRVRYAALISIGRLGDVRAARPVVARLLDSDWMLRREAVQVVRRLGAVEIAREAIAKVGRSSPDPDRRQCAADVLEQLRAD